MVFFNHLQIITRRPKKKTVTSHQPNLINQVAALQIRSVRSVSFYEEFRTLATNLLINEEKERYSWNKIFEILPVIIMDNKKNK